MDKKEINVIPYLKNYLRKIKKIIDVDKFILFGSRARNDTKINSDIDIIIISKDFNGVKYFRRAPKLYLMWDYPIDLDIICLTPKEFLTKIKEVGVMKQAKKEGIELA